MKTTAFFIILMIMPIGKSYGQNAHQDSFLYDSININGFYLGTHVEAMKSYFGLPIKQYTQKPQDDCEEWCERKQEIYYYGDMYYGNTIIGHTAIRDCYFKGLYENEKVELITAFELKSKNNNYRLSYLGTIFNIGDSLNSAKYQAIIPNSLNVYNNQRKNGNNLPFIDIKLLDANGQSVYGQYGVVDLRVYVSKEDIIEQISIDYPLE